MKESYNIVEVMPGKYALRKTEHQSYGNTYSFWDKNNNLWWSSETQVKKYCLTTDLTKLREDLQFYNSYGLNGRIVEEDIKEGKSGMDALAEIMKPVPPKARTIYEDIGKGLKNLFKFPTFKVRLKK